MQVDSIYSNSNSFCSRHGVSTALIATFVAIGVLAALNYYDVLRFLPRNVAFHPATLTVFLVSSTIATLIAIYKIGLQCDENVDLTSQNSNSQSTDHRSKSKVKKKKTAIAHKSVPNDSSFAKPTLLDLFVTVNGLEFLSKKDQGAVACLSRNSRNNHFLYKPLFPRYKLSAISLRTGKDERLPYVIWASSSTIIVADYYHKQQCCVACIDRNRSKDIEPLQQGTYEIVSVPDGSIRLINDSVSVVINPITKKNFSIESQNRAGIPSLNGASKKFYFVNESQMLCIEGFIFNAQLINDQFIPYHWSPPPHLKGSCQAINSKYFFSVRIPLEFDDAGYKTEITAYDFPEFRVDGAGTHDRYKDRPAWISRIDSEGSIHFQKNHYQIFVNEKWVVTIVQKLNSKKEVSFYWVALNAENGKPMFERLIAKPLLNPGDQFEREIRLFNDVLVIWKKELNAQELPIVWNIAKNRPLIVFDPKVIHQYRIIREIMVNKNEVWISGLLKEKDTVAFQCYTVSDSKIGL